MHKRKQGVVLHCFSPPVMLVTFIVEIVLAACTLWRYKFDTVARLTIGLLVFLGLFQISEYFVCGGVGLTAQEWARTGYVAITMLPPLGMHLLLVLAGKKDRRLAYVAYAMAAGFIMFFLGYNRAFAGYVCTGNYVIFQLAVHSGLVYGVYYYGWLLASIYLGDRWMRQLKARAGKVKTAVLRRQAVGGLVIGYLVFLVPTAIANTVSPATRRGIPSIMCGFAVLFAFILAGYILPRAAELRRNDRA